MPSDSGARQSITIDATVLRLESDGTLGSPRTWSDAVTVSSAEVTFFVWA